MKVKTNVHAGRQGRSSSTDSTSVSTPDVVAPPPPPVSYARCTGL